MTATMKFTSIAAVLLVSVVCVTLLPKATSGGTNALTGANAIVLTNLNSHESFDFITP